MVYDARVNVEVAPTDSDSSRARALLLALSLVVSVLAVLVVYLTPQQPVDGSPSWLSTINAVLNAAAGVSLLLGYVFIRKKQIAKHRASMLTAFGISTAFLVTYLMHHAQVGSVPFQGEGVLRVVYFAILIPHILLAALVLPLALFTLYRGLTGRIVKHKSIARITLPVWLFVSISGVVVYFMLYHIR